MLYTSGRWLFNSTSISPDIIQFHEFIHTKKKSILPFFSLVNIVSYGRSKVKNYRKWPHDTIKQNPMVEAIHGDATGMRRAKRLYCG